MPVGNFNHINKAVVFALFYLMISSSLIFSQSYQIKNYTQEDGLPNPVVYSIAQDQTGRMWFSTRAGICVYDGYEWKNFSVQDGLHVKEYVQIIVDSKNVIWAIPKGVYNHIMFYEAGRWNRIVFPDTISEVKPSVRCFAVINDSNPSVAVGTTKSGVFIYSHGDWSSVSAKEGLTAGSIYSIKSFEDHFYAATDRGIFRIDKFGNDVKCITDNIALPSLKIYNLGIERYGKGPDDIRIWTLDDSHLGYIEKNRYITEISDFGLKYLTLYTHRFPLVINYFDMIVFGNQEKLFFFNRNTKKLQLITPDNGFLVTAPNSIFLDRENLLWIAGNRGLSKLQSMRFQNFKKTNGLLMDEVTSVIESSPGKFVFGHNEGLSFYDGRKFDRLKFFRDETASQFSTRVMGLCRDSSGNIWIAGDMAGFGKMDKNRRITWFNKGINEFGGARSVVTDENGTVWGLNNSGLSYFSEGEFKSIPLEYTGKTYLRKITFSPAGDMCLLTTYSGILVKSGNDSLKKIYSRSNQYYNNVYSLEFVTKDSALVGTEAGLCCVDGDSIKKFQQNNFSIDYPIYFIEKDGKGNIWFGTDRGAVKWNGKEASFYDMKRGLSGLEANRDAGYLDSGGNFWIGTDRGVSEYVERYDVKKEFKPIVIIDSINGTKTTYPAMQRLEIPFSENNITLNTKIISFLDEENNLVYTKLEGYDEDWQANSLVANRSLRYTNLPPGTYQLSIRVKNADGEMSSIVKLPAFTILKPYYQEIWFYILIVLGATLTGYWVINSYNRIRYTNKLEDEVKERTALLYDSEKRYHQMFEENQAIMFLAESENGRIIDANKAASDFYGFKFSELIGKEISEIDDSFESGRIKEKMDEIFFNKKPLISLHHLAGGRERFVEIYCSLIEQQGKELYYVIVHDVTDRIAAEEALAESEEKYRSLVSHMLDGVFMIQDEKFVFANESFCEILGCEEKDVIGRKFQEFVDPEDVMRIAENYRRRMEGENLPNNYELKAIHRKKSSPIFLSLSVSLVNYGGKTTTIGTIKDITPAKEREDKLRQLSTAVEQSPVSIIITDTKGSIVYVNPKFIEDTGLNEEEVLNQNIQMVGAGILPGSHFENLWLTISSGKIWRGEFLNKRKSGSFYWVSAIVSPIFDNSGKIESYISFQEDITFQKYAAEEIRKSENMLNTVLSHSPIVTFALDQNGVFTLSKGKELKTLGLEQDEVVGRSVFDVYKDHDAIKEDVRRALKGETFTTITFISDLVYETLYSPIIDNNSVQIGILGVSMNITERFEAEKKLITAKETAERSDALKSAFLAQMSHEIRTPVNTILSFTSLLREEVRNKVRDELLNVFDFIDSGGRRLIRTIDLILDMSQFQTGTYVPNFNPVDINKDVLANVVTELKSLAERKNLELKYDVNCDSTLTMGDAYTIGQIFINLIDNAIKYTHKGGIYISVYEKEKMLCVDVKDTGIGISKEYLSIMFTPFSQEETGYTRRFEGTGLGLALVKKYCEINDAGISVDSEKGTGTTFTVCFEKTNGERGGASNQ